MRLYAIADVDYIYPLLSELGRQLFDDSRKNILGTQVIRCINHEQERIDSMFLPGVDANEVLGNCQIVSLPQAEQILALPTWSVFVPEPEEM